MNIGTKTILVGLVLTALIIACLPVSVSASLFYSKDRYVVPSGDTITDDIYIASSECLIGGTVTGDAMIATKDYTVKGEVLGSVNSFSQYATIRGTVGNTARIFAQTIILSGNITNNLLAFGQDIEISEDCRIGKDAYLFGNDISFSGTIGEDFKVEANQIVIAGKIDGNLKVTAEKISIVYPAEITGDIFYKSKNEIRIEDSVVVGGEVEWKRIEEDETKADSGLNWVWRILFFVASLVTGLFIIGLTNRHARIASTQIIDKPVVTLGVGFVAFCIIPVAIVVLTALIISIPVAIILLFTFTIFFYIAKIYVAIAIGRIALRYIKSDSDPKQGWSLLLGLFILTILFVVPVLGWLIYFAVIFWGIGAILLGLKACRVTNLPNSAAATGPTAPPPA